MVSGSELEVLKIVEEKGGETTVHAVARKMAINTDYARLICRGLAKADYLDILGGKLVLTPKGKGELERKRGRHNE